MKIAFLTPEFPHPKTGTAGGIGSSILNLAKGLVDLGHQSVVVVYGQNEDSVFSYEGIRIHKIKNVRFKGLSFWLTQKKVARYINSLVVKGEVDIVEAPDWTGFTAFFKLNCPLVVKLHGSDTYFCHLEKRPLKKRNFILEKRAFTNADAIVSVSQFTAELTNTLFNAKRDIAIIHNGIDTDKFGVLNSNNAPIILYFGTLIRKKGLLELPAIFNAVHERFPATQLWLIGKDAPDVVSGATSTWELMKPLFAPQAAQSVFYEGAVPYNEIIHKIQSAAVCVFPTFAEAFPVSWLEAMSMGKAVVASDIGWAKEVIDHGDNGFLAHPTQHDIYARYILALLQNDEQRIRMGNKAAKKIRNTFDLKTIALQTIERYTKIRDEFNLKK